MAISGVQVDSELTVFSKLLLTARIYQPHIHPTTSEPNNAKSTPYGQRSSAATNHSGSTKVEDITPWIARNLENRTQTCKIEVFLGLLLTDCFEKDYRQEPDKALHLCLEQIKSFSTRTDIHKPLKNYCDLEGDETLRYAPLFRSMNLA